jgi:hypothetical protein
LAQVALVVPRQTILRKMALKAEQLHFLLLLLVLAVALVKAHCKIMRLEVEALEVAALTTQTLQEALVPLVKVTLVEL